ncbi:ISA1 [Candida oxycetoniae]|uniref:Iron-sulfur assembly protein 1 n=1 Tax=Candida oxycetoniae TaxID=497107 RepID=A0AAI9SSR0_9ASCO|nr:ISA1 [Candida oxycetoniae]KAI3402474.2 ISA1 [Candida oxycetoniae]
MILRTHVNRVTPLRKQFSTISRSLLQQQRHQQPYQLQPYRLNPHSLPVEELPKIQNVQKPRKDVQEQQATQRRPRTMRFRKETFSNTIEPSEIVEQPFAAATDTAFTLKETAPAKEALKEAPKKALKAASSEVAPAIATKKPRTRVLRPRKQLITLTPSALAHLRQLSNQPNPKLIRIGVRNRGCSGLTYDLDYVDKPGKFDELIEQDGVKVLIDSKALFSIVGSEMDWLDDKLSSRFIFKNPNSKGTCGCGESFMV